MELLGKIFTLVAFILVGSVIMTDIRHWSGVFKGDADEVRILIVLMAYVFWGVVVEWMVTHLFGNKSR